MAKQPDNIPDFKGYNGNVNIKKIGVEVQWTPELLLEYAKCEKDAEYFVETYMKIVHVDHGLIPFILRDYQKEMLRSMIEQRRTVVVSARQIGKSTVFSAFVLWSLIFNSDITIGLLANKAEVAREILGRIQLAYEHLPKWLQQGVIKWNESTLELENNSRCIASSTTASAVRGYSLNTLIIDEAAHIDNWDEFFTSVFPTISSGETTKIILVSTPCGLNHFYKICVEAENKLNGYNHIKVMWDRVPGRDDKWKQDILAGLNFDVAKFEQEFECAFAGSSGTLINGAKLRAMAHKKPLYESSNIKQYFKPEKNGVYVCTVDVSRGKGLDYSAFTIFDVTKMPYEQVCAFHDNYIVPMDFADIVHKLCKTYNNAWIMVELNDLGQQVSDILYFTHEYEFMFSTESAGRAGKRVTAGYSKNTQRGMTTTKITKNRGCSMLKLLIENDSMHIHDFDTIAELHTFSRKNASYEAEAGKHDDLVMCLVIFAWLSDEQYFKDLVNINTIEEIRERKEEDISDDLMPFGFVDFGDELEELIEPSLRIRFWPLG